MFSYAGIPPLAGFCSKFYLFFAALGCGAYFLALVGVVTSVIGCFYYIRLVKRMFFDTPRTWILYEPMDRNKSLLLAMTSSFITSSFLYPSPLFSAKTGWWRIWIFSWKSSWNSLSTRWATEHPWDNKAMIGSGLRPDELQWCLKKRPERKGGVLAELFMR